MVFVLFVADEATLELRRALLLRQQPSSNHKSMGSLGKSLTDNNKGSEHEAPQNHQGEMHSLHVPSVCVMSVLVRGA